LSLATFEDLTGLVAGPSGARLGTLTNKSLIEALRKLGITHSTQEAMDDARKTLLAKKVPIFHHLTDEQIDHIVHSLIFVRLPQGSKLIDAGSPGTDFWIVARGEVEEVTEGREPRFIDKGGHLGVSALLSDVGQAPRCTASVASAFAELWQLERETFDAIVTGRVREDLQRRMRLWTSPVELESLRRISTLGSGTFGSVQLVESRATQIRYALKRIRRRNSKVAELVGRECAILAELDHSLILQLVKRFDTEGSIYILTEYCSGGDLLDALDNIARLLRPKEAQFYAASLLLVLEQLRERGIVYRDLKPENVMLDGEGYIKLIDFGTAKKLEPGDNERTFTMIGSWQFMAPEVAQGHGYGTEADLWSLGVMVFEFVCGFLPFGHGLTDSVTICKAVQTENLQFPEGYLDPIGRNLIRGLLRKEPARRLGTGIDGYHDLRDHQFFLVTGDNTTLFDSILARSFKAPYLPEVRDEREQSSDLEEGSDLAEFTTSP
jgi:cGMP-dependent protein kinase